MILSIIPIFNKGQKTITYLQNNCWAKRMKIISDAGSTDNVHCNSESLGIKAYCTHPPKGVPE
jgi:hypothetical protein